MNPHNTSVFDNHLGSTYERNMDQSDNTLLTGIVATITFVTLLLLFPVATSSLVNSLLPTSTAQSMSVTSAHDGTTVGYGNSAQDDINQDVVVPHSPFANAE